ACVDCSVSLRSMTVALVLARAGGVSGRAAAAVFGCCRGWWGSGHLPGRPADSCQAGQDGALEDLADVVQRDDQFLEPVQGGVLPVQQDAAVLLRGDGPAGQLDRVVLGAEQGLDGGVES